MLLPFVVAVVAIWFRNSGYHPSGDLALTELLTRDVGQHSSLIGPYSRDGWFHPGPALYYLLVVPYRLLGSSSLAMLTGAVLINAASVVAMAMLARRRGGHSVMLCTLVVCALLLRAMGAEILRTPWNPYITVLPFGVLMLLAWAMLCGDRWALPVGVGVTSFLIQTHVGYVVLATPLLAAGAVGVTRSAVRDGEGKRLMPAAGLATAVAAVMWLPPLLEQATGDTANLGRIIDYFREGGDTHTLVEGWRAVSAQFGLQADWFAGESHVSIMGQPDYITKVAFPILLLPVVLAGGWLWRRHGRAPQALIAVLLVAAGAGIFAVARTIGVLFAYRFGWAWVIGMVSGLLVLWALWDLLCRNRAAERLLTLVAVVALAVLCVVNGVDAWRTGVPDEHGSRAIGELTGQVAATLPDKEGDVVVTSTYTFDAMADRAGLILALERRGIAVRVTEADEAYGRHRQHREESLRAELTVVTNEHIPAYADNPEWEVVAYTGPLSVAEIKERTAQLEALQARHDAGEIDDVAFVNESRRILPSDSAEAVFLRKELLHLRP